MTSTTTTLAHHDTDPSLYAALVRTFGESEHGSTRWVALTVDGVVLNFYAPRNDVGAPTTESEAA